MSVEEFESVYVRLSRRRSFEGRLFGRQQMSVLLYFISEEIKTQRDLENVRDLDLR